MRSLIVSAGVAALLLSACAVTPVHASAPGTVTGRFQIQGGPIGPGGKQPGKRPISGTIQFTAGHGPAVTVRTGASGTFSARLAPGTYAVCARSPGLAADNSTNGLKGPCSASQSVRVTAGHTTRIALTVDVP
ncbi:MAG TPA: hypothetical protein VN840_12190 [Streptosporangiaceae bacterium]|nr:hypothetical protein [Streptosporangiaceae bacterium]